MSAREITPMPDTEYDAAEDGRRCYDLAIKAQRVELLEARDAAMLAVLKKIARGRGNVGGNRALPAEQSRQLARGALVDIGEDW